MKRFLGYLDKAKGNDICSHGKSEIGGKRCEVMEMIRAQTGKGEGGWGAGARALESS